ncbi:hypothetical protein BBO_08277 [Beauveria brongniartii RCEF 3172]|uniref:Uncharacterized protein n=1 Tax=Beauveria brongniartii RCEF 3172 TaxID=1081107 RepID=A0A166Y0M2_9HYPO|nr:hypothetical protein BBO_08277 [Beauveria brongniartii RCEF 3172]
MSSNSCCVRAICSASDSYRSECHSESCSANPASSSYSGYVLLIHSLLPLRSQAWSVNRSRRNSSYAIPTLLKAVKDSLKGNHWATILLHSLIHSRDCEATNLEDKVYALLGLVQDSVDLGIMPLLRPEFGGRSRIGKTYLNLAIQLLGDCEDLLVLASVERKPFQTVDLGGGRPLPSWVPDWSCRLPLGLRVTGLKRYSADACFLPPDMSLSRAEKLARWPAHVNQDENTVAIGAVKVDEIVSLEYSLEDQQSDSSQMELVQ